jgi:hypothetical protein
MNTSGPSMMEQPETCLKTHHSRLPAIYRQKNPQISGISSPKMTLCMTGNTTSLWWSPSWCLAGFRLLHHWRQIVDNLLEHPRTCWTPARNPPRTSGISSPTQGHLRAGNTTNLVYITNWCQGFNQFKVWISGWTMKPKHNFCYRSKIYFNLKFKYQMGS